MADRRRNLGMPSGVVFPFAGTAAPYGYLICDGRAISRAEYPQLFLSIGTSHGQGNGSTTFNLPDYRGQFLRGRVDITTINGSGTAASNNATFNNHGINRTGFKVRLSSGALTGLAGSTDYFAIVIDANTLAFATSLGNAIAGTKAAISGVNSAVIVQYEDPDASSRTASTVGANSGEGLGSMQNSALEPHNHNYIYRDRNGAQPAGATVNLADQMGYKADFDVNRFRYFTETQGPSGNFSSESRPKNMLINYIIKI